MVASGFIDDVARGSMLWDRSNVFGARESATGVGHSSGPLSNSSRDRLRSFSTMFLEDALVN